jgi:ethylbenzene hydroxylase subunit beta/complex iron-sulfur molybdoenzyme family reductase subunit beta
LHPEYGTEPNVFYVPPLNPAAFDENGNIDESKPRIPDEYLISVFGPQVLDSLKILKAEMAKRKAGEPSELMDILIAYKWEDNFGGFDRDPQTIDWHMAGNEAHPIADDSNGRFAGSDEVSPVKIIDPRANA